MLGQGLARPAARGARPGRRAGRAGPPVPGGAATAADRDLAKWAGLPLRDARRGLTAIAAGLSQHADGLASLGQRTWRPAARVTHGRPPGARLLGSFDPLLHGWVSREPVLGGRQGVVTTNGIFRPFALVRGRGVATWGLARGRVALTPFAPLAAADEAALMADAADVLRFLGERAGHLRGVSAPSDRPDPPC